MSRLRVLSVSCVILAGFATSACARREPVRDGGAAALRRNLLRAGRVEVWVSERAAEDRVQRAARRLARWGGVEGLDVSVRASGQSDDPRAARFVVATASSGVAVALAADAGFQVGPAGERASFRYGAQAFDGADDAFVATFEDRERPGLPLTLAFGNSIHAAACAAGDLAPGWRPWLRVFRSGDLVLSGPLETSGAAAPGALDRLGLRRIAAERGLAPLLHAPPGVVGRAHADLAEERVDRYLARCLAARVHVAAWASPDRVVPATEVTLWSTLDDFALGATARGLARFDPVDGRVDALVLDDLDDGAAAVGSATAAANLGLPVEPWMLDAAGLDAAWTWWGTSLDRWLALLVSAGRDLAPAELVDARATERVSAHVVAPMRAALWRFLRETRGERFLREVWQGTRALDLDPSGAAAFAGWLSGRGAAFASAIEAERAARRVARAIPVEWRGVGLAEPVDARARGFGSRAFHASLAEAQRLGANAVSFTTFVVDDPGLVELSGALDARDLGPRGGDLGLFLGLCAAQRQGLGTLLQPELLGGPGGTWSGAWTRRDRADWSAFFERYLRFVEHAACVAALARTDVLALGSGIVETSSAESEGRRAVAEEAHWKRAGWEAVIRGARALFAGDLTFQASSPEHAARIDFWPALDFLGLEVCPTLEFEPAGDGPGAEARIGGAIERALADVALLAARHAKPVLVTRASFLPNAAGAADLRAARGEPGAWVARQFEMLAAATRRSAAGPAPRGVFAWRWSTDLGDRGAGANDVLVLEPVVRAALGSWFAGR